ncbi:MAG: PDZ domain-containing protein [Chloroflexi bacterium]|nr:PDZ domain-containing protein [Chloroflexota bacterium]MYE42010.1 PDZ domain-containing protein [Chloroflexota bacterium]
METFLFAVGTLAPLLLILVVVHELGHFATARAIGVKVLEFGVGFPPRVFGVYTGRTQVLLHTRTRFIGLEGPQSLRPGQRVKVASIHEEDLGLVAVEVELHRQRDEDEEPSHFNRPVDHLLWHEGKVRSVSGGSFELADMLYSVNLIPLGGFVKLAGENNPTVPQSLASKSPAARIMVLSAGALMNALLPLLIFTIMFMLPQEEEVGRLAVAEVLDGSPAAQAGLRPGDIFVAANGQAIESRVDLTREINLNGGSEVTLLVERERSLQTVTLTPAFNTRSSQWQVGVAVDLTETRVVSRSRALWDAIPASVTATWDLLVLLKQTVGGMISHGAAPQLSGPVGIAQMTGEISRDGGFIGWLTVGILLSVNLAIINILPFPMLDGGRIVFVVIEWLRRGKRIPAEKENLVHLVGLVILVGGIAAITVNDVSRIIEGVSILGG